MAVNLLFFLPLDDHTAVFSDPGKTGDKIFFTGNNSNWGWGGEGGVVTKNCADKLSSHSITGPPFIEEGATINVPRRSHFNSFTVSCLDCLFSLMQKIIE